MKLVIFLFAVPLVGQQVASPYSPEKERALGESLAAEVRRHSEPLRDPEIQAYVDRAGAELVSRMEGELREYRFEVVSGMEQGEPCALPGGHVFVPARLLLTARDEHEFAGLLAHAAGHAALGHGTRVANREQVGSTASIPIVFMGGCASSHADSRVSSLLVPASLLPSQRANEPEADRFGVALAARAGFDASAFLRYVERTHPVDSARSPLPPRDARIAALRAALPPEAAGTRPSSGEFERVRERVRSVLEGAERHPRAPSLRR